MPTLLHISDLHRTSDPRPSNDDLLSAIVSDTKRWKKEGIPRPDLIVVSGDLIQGVALKTSNADSKIRDQYREASNFLISLAQEFTNSDRSKVIIVPGNHDVHWARALDAMKPLDDCPSGISKKSLEATSNVRWNWKEQKAYEIFDEDVYASRLEHFREFQRDFYKGLENNLLLKVNGDLVFAQYPDLGLIIAGFASWYGNDCFCHVGDIDSSILSESQKLLTEFKEPVAIAVWHHGIAGAPKEHDYMDQRVIHRLIDFGFHVGLHGHHHYSAATPFELNLPNMPSMAIIGAGSLAVGDNELPMGERRQFNIVEINPDKKSISVTVHVRGMSQAKVFSSFHRDDFGGKASIKLKIPFIPDRPPKLIPDRPQDMKDQFQRRNIKRRYDDVMMALGEKQFDKVLKILPEISAHLPRTARQIEIYALEGMGDHERLIGVLSSPQSVDEAIQLISILLNLNRIDEADNQLSISQTMFDPTLFNELSKRIEIEKMISKG